MNPVLLVIIIIAVIAGIFLIPLGLAAASTMRGGLTRTQKTELRELRKFKQDVRAVTARTEDVNPELAAQIQSLLYDIETKELND